MYVPGQQFKWRLEGECVGSIKRGVLKRISRRGGWKNWHRWAKQAQTLGGDVVIVEKKNQESGRKSERYCVGKKKKRKKGGGGGVRR